MQEAEQYACDVMIEAGCEQYNLTDDELNTFVEASKAVIEEYRSVVDPELYEMMGL